MGTPKRIKADHRADTRGKPWAGIPHVVLESPAYIHCDLWERAILVELVLAFKGFNNGKIALSQRQIAARLRTSNFRRIGRSIAGLMEKGLIDVAIEGRWKERMARQYRLTFVNTGTNGRFTPATNDYRDWSPEVKSRAEYGSAAASEAAEPASADAKKPAAPVSANPDRKPRETDLIAAEPASSLIGKPYLTGEMTDAGVAEVGDDPGSITCTRCNNLGLCFGSH